MFWNVEIDIYQIIKCFNAYMKALAYTIPAQKQFLLNIEEKEQDEQFTGDMEGLIRPGVEYN